jgi:hypothetical protein
MHLVKGEDIFIDHKKQDLKKPKEDIKLQKKTAANVLININVQMAVEDGYISMKTI